MAKDTEVLNPHDELVPYLVIQEGDKLTFEMECQRMIRVGFVPQGGVEPVFDSDARIYGYCQAFVKLKT